MTIRARIFGIGQHAAGRQHGQQGRDDACWRAAVVSSGAALSGGGKRHGRATIVSTKVVHRIFVRFARKSAARRRTVSYTAPFFFTGSTSWATRHRKSPRTGGNGSTGLGDGSRTSKDNVRIHAMATWTTELAYQPVRSHARRLARGTGGHQHDLFDLGGEICIPGYQLIKEEHVLRLERPAGEIQCGLARLE